MSLHAGEAAFAAATAVLASSTEAPAQWRITSPMAGFVTSTLVSHNRLVVDDPGQGRRLRICSHVYRFLGLILGDSEGNDLPKSKNGGERKAEDRGSGSTL